MTQTILVVDDSHLARTVLKSHLRNELPAATVVTAANGAQAKRLLEACREPLALVTTALMLPDMDGLDLCRYVRASRGHRHTPVVVVSADADQGLWLRGLEAGVNEYFDKGRGTDSLAAFVKEFVQRSPGYVGRVLYVEDSRTAAAHGRSLMERQGLEVEHLASAEAAIARLRRQDLPLPDLVVTDFFLGGEGTGEELLRYIRLERRCSPQELPVLVVTGSTGAERHAEVLARGANDFIEKPVVGPILIARIRSLLLVRHAFAALQRQSRAMRQMALTDSLTGARNKRHLLEFGDTLLANGASPAAVLISDIDHFKGINDEHGHLLGDRVLAALGRLLTERFAESDGHTVARFGGEEFVIVLTGTSTEAAIAAAEALREAVAALRPAGIALTISAGLAGSDRHPGRDMAELVALADRALYEAKRGGRDRVCVAEVRPQPAEGS